MNKVVVLIAWLLVSVAHAADAVPAPQFLLGVWGTEESLFLGDTLMKGEAIYIGTDGKGVLVGGGGEAKFTAAQLRIVSYNPKTRLLTFDLVANGKIVAANKTCVYDPRHQWLVFANSHFYHRFPIIALRTKFDLGLE